ncbi:hypothetical protein HHK36_007702 [Tetracentron sinense]|uniref:GTPase Der C-terminal KH-domain-like domain-containing protein n=1 Tax=Tetracentron sinense TaxID=13715 RepID=A0A834ZF27_TETSI|nr:hypothetical protein HHK36_007702 [Tetracentron sinense]
MKHAEVVIARRAVEEGRGLVVIVNKMDLLRGTQNSKLYEKVIKAVPEEIQTILPQVTGIPVVFVSALEGRGRIAIMRQVIDTYEKWCLRLPTARLNRWLCKVMSRHSLKDQASQPKIKYFTQVKARPPTFVAFVSGKTQLSDTDLRFLTKSLKEDFDIGGIPIRIMQRSVPRKARGCSGGNAYLDPYWTIAIFSTVYSKVTGIPVVFVSALEGRGRIAIMRQVIDTYEKWCLRLPTARLNRWLCKVMSRHSLKDQASQPKIKYFTQVKARPPTFVAFVSGKTQLSDTDLRFLTKSLKEDFDIGGIPIRIMQRSVPRKARGCSGGSKCSQSTGRMFERILSDKRSVSV